MYILEASRTAPICTSFITFVWLIYRLPGVLQTGDGPGYSESQWDEDIVREQ